MKQQITTILLIALMYFKIISNTPINQNNPIDETGSELASWDEWHPQNPEELGAYFEGDIIITPLAFRNGIIGEAYRWKNGLIPFEISGYFSSNDRKMIKTAMDTYHKYTCLSFRPRTRLDKDYLSITNYNTGCWSSVGRKGGSQQLNLQSPQCTTKLGTCLHELMHAAGFLHEQNREERDDYVTIEWENIKKGREHNFDKADENTANDFGVPYDFVSVMHYSSTAFSSNGKRTIIPKGVAMVANMGQRVGFSQGDIIKLNAMYNCPEKSQLNFTGDTTNETTDNSTGNREDLNPWLQAANGLFSIFVNN